MLCLCRSVSLSVCPIFLLPQLWQLLFENLTCFSLSIQSKFCSVLYLVLFPYHYCPNISLSCLPHITVSILSYLVSQSGLSKYSLHVSPYYYSLNIVPIVMQPKYQYCPVQCVLPYIGDILWFANDRILVENNNH